MQLNQSRRRAITRLSYSPKSLNIIAAGSADGQVHVWVGIVTLCEALLLNNDYRTSERLTAARRSCLSRPAHQCQPCVH